MADDVERAGDERPGRRRRRRAERGVAGVARRRRCRTTSSQPMARAALGARRPPACRRLGARGAADHDVHLVGPQRLEHRRRVAPGEEARRPGSSRPTGSKSSNRTAGAGVGAGRVVGAVDDDQRLVAEHLEPPRHPDRGEGLLARRPASSGASKNASAAVERDGRRCRPGGGRAAAGTARRRSTSGVRRSSRRPPSASWFSMHVEVDAALLRPAPAPAAAEDGAPARGRSPRARACCRA